MTLDPVANLISLTVSGTYSSSATSIVVVSGGSSLPTTGSFNATWWNSTDYPNPASDPYAEIVRVNGTGISGNTLPVTRGQEGIAATAKNITGKTYTLMLGITAKMMADIGNNLQQPWKLTTLTGAVNGTNTVYTLANGIAPFDATSMDIKFARQPQEQGIDYTISGITITYITPFPAALSGQPHTAKYQ